MDHLQELSWALAIPYEETEAMGRCEDMCEAEFLPQVSIINLQKGFTEVAIKDVKGIILRKHNMNEAVEELRQEIINAW